MTQTSHSSQKRTLYAMSREELIDLCESLLWENYQWHRTRSNPCLSPTDKLVLDTVMDIVEKRKEESAETVQVWRNDIIERTALGKSTVSLSLGKLAKSGIITKEIKGSQGKAGNPTKDMFLGVPEQTRLNPGGVALTEERNHGGKRTYCPGCGSDRIVELKKYICLDCGVVVKEMEARSVNKDPEGRLVIFAEPDRPAPPRDCIKCGSRCWTWNQVDGKWESSCND